jgi:hypothetical protein
MLCIRFHFGGWFEKAGAHVHYLGGDIAESWIDVDKLSYFEIKGHMEDHYRTKNVIRLYWLKPHMDMTSGLVLLVDMHLARSCFRLTLLLLPIQKV